VARALGDVPDGQAQTVANGSDIARVAQTPIEDHAGRAIAA
jgi:hypothetical protein